MPNRTHDSPHALPPEPKRALDFTPLARGAHPAPWLHAKSGRQAIVLIGHGGVRIGEDWVRDDETPEQAAARCAAVLSAEADLRFLQDT